MDIQQSIFDYLRTPFSIDKPIRLIEIFAGYGSQSKILQRVMNRLIGATQNTESGNLLPKNAIG